MYARFQSAVALTLVGASIALLTGCSASAAAADTEQRLTVVYSAWVDGGDIASVEHDENHPADGALSFVDHPKKSRWSTSATVLHDRTLTVTPTGDGVAHCLISAPAKKTVLAAEEAKPGAPVTCDATIAPAG